MNFLKKNLRFFFVLIFIFLTSFTLSADSSENISFFPIHLAPSFESPSIQNAILSILKGVANADESVIKELKILDDLDDLPAEEQIDFIYAVLLNEKNLNDEFEIKKTDCQFEISHKYRPLCKMLIFPVS